MLKEGMFIQERYEIIGRIGSGGMADVYKAKDHKLNRYIAVKVLKAEFREDKAFVSKFRIEAQSAAGLAHPNIVNVYDVGEENGINYIVMELVEGITLKEYIEKKGRLAVREATSIAIQVSMGLQAAHQNNIVHRDVKPQNIIISTDGKVKVTDFGIARAASSNTISSNVMGSVHYSSPEQARGGYSDSKGDIYSLGITMYEMLTGHVPFDGDTTVAIAIKHLQEEMQSPRKYVADLPKSTVQIIYKCTQKSPDRRYIDMEELIRDLKESLVNPEGDFVEIMPLTNHAQTVVISKDELDQIKQGAAEEPTGQGEYVQNQPPQYNNYGNDPYNNSYNNYGAGYPGEFDDEYYPDDEDDDVNKKKERFLTISSIVIGIVILLIFLLLVGNAANLISLDFLTGGKKKGNETTAMTDSTETNAAAASTADDQPAASADEELISVPDLLGKTKDEATQLLNSLGLKGHEIGTKESADYPEGQIMEQDPVEGAYVAKNSKVVFYISKGQGEVTVPDVVKRTLTEAQEMFRAVDLKISPEYVYDNNIAEGLIISSEPSAGVSVSSGTTVTLKISKGPQNGNEEDGEDDDIVTVPSVVGSKSGVAKSQLEEMGLYVEIHENYSSEYAAGTIMRQSISAGKEVSKGTTIDLDVSIGDLGESDPDKNADGSISYACNVNLKAPEGYAGEAVEISIEQDGVTTTLVSGQAIQFPYNLKWSSDSDSEGIAFIYITNKDGSVTTVRYDGIPFIQVD